MSHLKERKDKYCLNCNAVVNGRYCGVCGQENLEPQESTWHLIMHFFNDITHFDGKFFSSLKYLLFKPGFLSEEYVSGRRASYLNPVRMYVFTSFIFFLIFFSFFSNEEDIHVRKKYRTTNEIAAANKIADSIKAANKDLQLSGGLLDSLPYRDKAQYDSLIDAGSVHNGFFKRIMVHKQLALKKKYGTDEDRLNSNLINNFTHSAPQIFFLSLPLFALVLKLLYIRRKKFYYVAHTIFTVHLYIFIYIVVLATFIVSALSDLPHMSWLNWLIGILAIAIFFYAYKAMRYFYGQGRWKTILKFIISLVSLMFIIMLSAIIMFFFSVYKL